MQKTIHDEGYRALIERLKDARKECGFTQAEVAERLRMSRAWIGKIERYEVRLDPVYLIAICRVYRLSAQRLIGELEEHNL